MRGPAQKQANDLIGHLWPEMAVAALVTKRVHIHDHYGIRPQKTILKRFWGPTSIIVVYIDPLGKFVPPPPTSSPYAERPYWSRTSAIQS